MATANEPPSVNTPATIVARNGKVVTAKLVKPDDEIMLITSGGILIRTRVNEVREMSRATQGVTLINLDAGEKLAGLERVIESDDDDNDNSSDNEISDES